MAHYTFTVILTHQAEEDEIQPILTAIRQIRGVEDVVPYVANTAEIQLAKNYLRREIMSKVIEILQPGTATPGIPHLLG